MEREFDVKTAGRFRVILRKGPAVKARLQEMGPNSRQLQLMDYVREHGRTTNRAYRELTSLSDEAARREIAGLLDLGLLEQIGKGRSTAHVLKRRVGDYLAIPEGRERRQAPRFKGGDGERLRHHASLPRWRKDAVAILAGALRNRTDNV